MSDSNYNNEQINVDTSKVLIDSFLEKYPLYRQYLDEFHHINPITCDDLEQVVNLYDELCKFYTADQKKDVLVHVNIQDIHDLILSQKVDQLWKDLREELDRKTEYLSVRERRNFYLDLKMGLGKGLIIEEVDEYIYDELVSFREVESDTFRFKTVWEGLKLLRRHCKDQLKYWKQVEPGVGDPADDFDPVKTSVARKVLWAYELGIIDHILGSNELDGNFTQAAKILAPMLDAKPATLRKVIDDLYKNPEGKNNPKNSKENLAWFNSTSEKLKVKYFKTSK